MDDRLRELERAHRSQASPEAELRWLRGRVAAGLRLEWSAFQRLTVLDPELATDLLRPIASEAPDRFALMCHAGNRCALALAHSAALKEPPSIRRWLEGLSARTESRPWNPDVLIVMALTLTRLIELDFRAGECELQRRERGIAAARAWLACPCSEHAQAARDVYDQFRAAGGDELAQRPHELTPHPAVAAAMTASLAAWRLQQCVRGTNLAFAMAATITVELRLCMRRLELARRKRLRPPLQEAAARWAYDRTLQE